MQSLQILVIGTNSTILETILRLIRSQPGWIGVGANSYSTALEMAKDEKFDLVLIGGGLPQDKTSHFKESFRKINPITPVIQHYGGGSGLLFGEIFQALGHKKSSQ